MSESTKTRIALRDRPGSDAPPVVSVCMTTYNHRRFIEEAVESVLMQETDFPVEILLYDDCSTDGTGDIVRGYSQTFPGLVIPYIQAENRYSKGHHGLPFLFKHVRGKYVTVLECDDAWVDPGKLTRQVTFLEEHHDCIICFGNVRVVDAAGKTLQELKISPEGCRILSQRELIAARHSIPTSAVMYRNHPLLQDLPDAIHRVLNGDSFLYALLGQYGRAGFVDIVPSLYRQHADGIYSSLDSDQRRCARIRTLKALMPCIKAPSRPWVAEAISESFLAQVNDLRRSRNLFLFASSIAAFVFFSWRSRSRSDFLRDLRSCAYHIRRVFTNPPDSTIKPFPGIVD